MNKYTIFYVTFFILLIWNVKPVEGQELDRSLIREGVSLFKDSSFVEAEIAFRKAYQENKTDTAAFNISTSLHAQERYDESIAELDRLITNTSDKILKSQAYFNKGNALVRLEKLEESLEEYKNALRNNPADHAARYNYLMVKRLLEQQPPQQNQDQNQDQDQDQNKDQDKNQDKKDQGDKGDKEDEEKEDEDSSKDQGDDQEDQDQDNKDGDQGDEGDQEKDQDQQNDGNQPKEGELSREDALRLLQALEEAEEKTQEKVKAKKIKGGIRTNEKDW